jgi:hypothetical protein
MKVAIADGRGKDLNRGGMAVFAGIELSIDEQVEVEFTPPYAGRPLRVKAFVRNRRGYVYGIEFITENDADYRNVGQLESMLKTLSSVSWYPPHPNITVCQLESALKTLGSVAN